MPTLSTRPGENSFREGAQAVQRSAIPRNHRRLVRGWTTLHRDSDSQRSEAPLYRMESALHRCGIHDYRRERRNLAKWNRFDDKKARQDQYAGACSYWQTAYTLPENPLG